MQTQPSYVKAISILHRALLVGQLLMGILLFALVFFKNAGSFAAEDKSRQWLIACLVLAGLCWFISDRLFKRKLENINNGNEPASKKLDAYRATSITR